MGAQPLLGRCPSLGQGPSQPWPWGWFAPHSLQREGVTPLSQGGGGSATAASRGAVPPRSPGAPPHPSADAGCGGVREGGHDCGGGVAAAHWVTVSELGIKMVLLGNAPGHCLPAGIWAAARRGAPTGRKGLRGASWGFPSPSGSLNVREGEPSAPRPFARMESADRLGFGSSPPSPRSVQPRDWQGWRSSAPPRLPVWGSGETGSAPWPHGGRGVF